MTDTKTVVIILLTALNVALSIIVILEGSKTEKIVNDCDQALTFQAVVLNQSLSICQSEGKCTKIASINPRGFDKLINNIEVKCLPCQ